MAVAGRQTENSEIEKWTGQTGTFRTDRENSSDVAGSKGDGLVCHDGSLSFQVAAFS